MTTGGCRVSRVAIFTDDPGWHGEVLVSALAARGVEATLVSLKDCALDCSGTRPFVRVPRFDAGLPDAAFVRGVPGGTVEEVVLRLNMLHCLELLGVPVFNTGRAIERTVDKAMTTFLLHRRGIPTPRTWVCESAPRARALAMQLFASGAAVVIKPVFGSQGEGVVRARNVHEFDACVPMGGVYYLQEYVDRGGPPYRDWRVLVVAGRTALAMRRQSSHWVTNRARGAECYAVEPDAAMRTLAEAAVAAVDIDYAGVDLLHGAAGQWLVGEVNGIPAWKGLQEATGVDVGAMLCDAFLVKIRASRPAAQAGA